MPSLDNFRSALSSSPLSAGLCCVALGSVFCSRDIPFPFSRSLPSSPDPASIAGNILVLLWLRTLGSSFLFMPSEVV
ncbi:hypothetical protein SLE2022_051340 [Rubroshorea leprosula]